MLVLQTISKISSRTKETIRNYINGWLSHHSIEHEWNSREAVTKWRNGDKINVAL